MSMLLLLFILSIVFQLDATPRKTKDEDKHNEMQTRLILDKLDMHFYEKKETDELIKSMLTTLEKRTQALDIAETTITEFDRRLANIESFLLSNAGGDHDRTLKTQSAARGVIDFSGIMEKIKSDIIQEIEINKIKMLEQQSIYKDNIDNVQQFISSKIDSLSSSIQKIQEELLTLKNQDSQKLNKQTNEQLERIEFNVNKNKEILEELQIKYDCSNIVDEVSTISKNDTEKVLIEIKMMADKLGKLPEKSDLNVSKDQTVISIDNLKANVDKHFSYSTILFEEKTDIILSEMNQIKESVLNTTASQINQNDDSQKCKKLADDTLEVIRIHLDENRNLLDKYEDSLTAYDSKIKVLTLNDEIEISCHTNSIQAFAEQSDGNTERKIRCSVQRAFPEIGDVINRQSKKINFTINERLNTLQTSSVNDVNEDFKILTFELDLDVEEVWRQISTWHQRMNENINSLNKLEHQTVKYENGSLNAIVSLKEKFDKSLNKMDDSINHLENKLQDLTSEVIRIKTVFETTLDEIKKGVQEIQDKNARKNVKTPSHFLDKVTSIIRH